MSKIKWEKQDIINLRNLLGITRSEFASLLGVYSSTIARWESGYTEPTGAGEAVLNGLREKLKKDPETSNQVLSFVADAAVVGGLSYLIVRLLDEFTKINSVQTEKRRKK